MKVNKCFLKYIIFIVSLASLIRLISSIPAKEITVIPEIRLKHLALIQRLIFCESGGRSVKHLDRNGLYSYGVLQIQKATWDGWSKESGLGGDPMNVRDAKEMADWALENGKIGAWSCTRLLGLKK